MPGFAVKTQVFEGPLEVLLELVEKRKLLVSDLSLAQVADDFVAYLQSLPEMPEAEVAQFVLVASTLLLIKSRALLPAMALTPEEEQSVHDLERRLEAYRRLRDASRRFARGWLRSPSFERRGRTPEAPVFAPPRELTAEGLMARAQAILAKAPKLLPKMPQALVRKAVSLEEAVSHLATRIKTALAGSFRELAGLKGASRHEAAVRFLALLELVRRGIVRTQQGDHFSDIKLEAADVGTPRYT
jgi:segregation and condensation protein A